MIKIIKTYCLDSTHRTVLLTIVSGLALVVSFFDIGHLPIDAAWLAILLSGLPILKAASIGLFTRFDIRAGVLVSIALIAAVIIGEIFAAGEVAFIMMLGEILEEKTVAKARAGIENLIKLTPQTARVVREGVQTIIPAQEVKIGDILQVLAGETIAVDGVILEGQSAINQAVMTGESLPADKTAGDEVFSGTINQFGTFQMRASKIGADSSLQRMVRLVESADAGKAKIVRLADKWSTWIVAIALISATLTWIFTGEVIRAVTVLVVFCPCALVLATPTAIMAAIGNATRYGILVRSGETIERLAKITDLAFDKTGTLTSGQPAVVAIESIDETQLSATQLLLLAGSAELRSEHPLGKAIIRHIQEQTQTCPPQPESFSMLAGCGVQARVNGQTVLAGNAKWLSEQLLTIPQILTTKAATQQKTGCTIIYLALEQSVVGFIALADTVRENARTMINNTVTLGINTILISGDNQQTAQYIGQKLGISDIHANCLPENKMTIVEAYQTQGRLLCMVGDGVNDAPALKKAYVGIAMGTIGSDIAVDAADVVLVRDEIKHLPLLLYLSQKTIRTIKINIILSMALNFIAIVLAMSGILSPMLGALVHNIGSVAVVLNSTLLLNTRFNDPRTEDTRAKTFSASAQTNSIAN